MSSPSPERRRLAQDAARERNWKRWGPYLAERQWGTVREDYSANGDSWAYFPHDHARSRAYRWGEDGLLGICDREARLCFALALWNGRDPILKERLFGLANEEGNHGEDVKEAYFFLDGTPTASYLKALYKYPQAEFPYERLRRENRARTRRDPEFELADTGIFDGGRLFDVQVEYAKAAPDDILVRISVDNLGPEAATLHLLPTLWFRNTWSWGRDDDEYPARPAITSNGPAALEAVHPTLGRFTLVAGAGPDGRLPELLFTDNETNTERLFGKPNQAPFVKDAFHDRVVGGRESAVNPAGSGHERRRLGTASRCRPEQVRRCACASRPRARCPPSRSAPPSTPPSPPASARPTSSTPPSSRPGSSPPNARSRARRTPAWSGRSSSTTWSCPSGSTATPPNRRRRFPA